MTRTRVKIDPGHRRNLPAGRVNAEVLDATTERDIAARHLPRPHLNVVKSRNRRTIITATEVYPR